LTDEYDKEKKELEKDDYNGLDDAHSTLGDSSNKIYENFKAVADENKEDNVKDKGPNIKKKN
jgi:hypothetical protein